MSKATDQEAIFGVVPVLRSEKTYGFFYTTMVTGGYAIATWCYTQGAFMATSVPFRAFLTSLIGPSVLILTLLSLLSIFAIRYGVDIWIWMRSVFGDLGQRIIAVACVLMIMPWFSVCADIFAGSFMRLTEGFGIDIAPGLRPWIGVLCVVLGLLIAVGGPPVIKFVNPILLISLIAVGGVAIYLAFTSVPTSELIGYAPEAYTPTNYALNVEAGMAFAFSWAMAIALIPRLCNSERKGYWATSVSYGLIAPFFVFIGGVLCLAVLARTGIASDDPSVILFALGGPVALLIFANIGTAGTGTYLYAMILKAAFPKVKYIWIAVIVAGYVGILTLWVGAVEHFGAFISYSAFLIAPISGMLLVDFFIVRKQRISLRALYAPTAKRCNPLGFAALAVGLLAGLLVYNPATGEILSPIFYVFSGSGFSFLAGGVAYLILSLLAARVKGSAAETKEYVKRA
jgi:NCS1 family nucleobase:cation symporter-1